MSREQHADLDFVGASRILDLPAPSADEEPVRKIDINSRLYRIPHTWAIGGDIAIASGDTDYICPFFIDLETNQQAWISRASHRINSGTSATVKLTKNEVDMVGFTGITVTPTPSQWVNSPVALASSDRIALVVTAVNGSPRNLSFTVFVDTIVEIP